MAATSILLACGGASNSTPAATKDADAGDTKAKAAEAKVAEAKVAETKVVEAKALDTKVEAKVAETKGVEAKAPDTKHPRLDVAPNPELAVVATAAGVVVLDAAGKTVGELSPKKPHACRVDARAGVLWVHEGSEDEGADLEDFQTGKLTALDLESDAAPITVLTKAPSTFVIDYGDEQLGREEPHLFQEGVVIHMTEPPRVEAILGCDGDMSWACFGEDEEDEERARARMLAKLAKRIRARPFPAEALAPWVARGKARRATPSGPGPTDAPRKVAVPKRGCAEEPEDCGKAQILPGGRYWRVVVGNNRGDFFHETFSLYDPTSDELFDPTDPAARRKPSAADPDAEGFEPSWISPSAELAADGSTLVRLAGGVIARDLEGFCGFWGGGWTL